MLLGGRLLNSYLPRKGVLIYMTKKTFRIVFILAALARLITLGIAPFWYDEAYTGIVTRLGSSQAFEAVAGDVHPPAFYIFNWVYHHLLGPLANPWTLRLPSALLSLVCIYLSWLIAKRINLPPVVQTVVISLMAFSPWQIHFAQEYRMYALFECLVLVNVLGIIERNPKLINVSAAILLYTHNYGIFYVVTLAGIAVIRELPRPVKVADGEDVTQQSQLKPILRAYGLAVFFYIPWIIFLLAQMGFVNDGYWIRPTTIGQVFDIMIKHVWGYSVPLEVGPAIIIATAAFLAAGLWEIRKDRKRLEVATIILWFAGPVVLGIVAGILWRPVFFSRPVIGASFPLYTILAWPLVSIKKRLTLWALYISAGLILAMCLINYYVTIPKGKGEGLDMLRYVQEHYQTGDIVYSISDGSAVGFKYYTPELSQFEMTPCEFPDPGSLSPPTREALGIVTADLEVIPFTRAWVVWSDFPMSTLCEFDRAKAYVENSPLIMISRDDEFVRAGLWLVERK
jgi:hypothetical protein